MVNPSVSVIVPVLNEAGMIGEIVRRIPDMGQGTEIIFVSGCSHDDTSAEIIRQTCEHLDKNIKLLHQIGKGKADAVQMGFNHAVGDVLVILDGDLSVAPGDLPRFLNHVKPGVLVIGSRMLEMNPSDATMRPLNIVANHCFARIVSWICGQRVSDSLCGTKVLMRSDWQKMKMLPHDTYGDFSIIFGAVENGMRIVNVPVVYHSRQYGKTKINRFRGGLSLLRVCLSAAWRIKVRGLDKKCRSV